MKLNQKGFSPVIILVTVVVVGLVGGAGWYVYKNQTPKQQKTNSTGKTDSNQQTVQQTSGNIVKIPEMGIQFTVPDEIKGISYIIEKQTDSRGKEVVYARLTSQSLMKVSPECGAARESLGIVTKGFGNKPEETEEPRYYGELIKQFDSFFITYTPSQAACSNSDGESEEFKTSSELQLKQEVLLKKAMTTVTPL